MTHSSDALDIASISLLSRSSNKKEISAIDDLTTLENTLKQVMELLKLVIRIAIESKSLCR